MSDATAWDALVLAAADDVAVALRDLVAGTRARVRREGALVEVTLREAIALGHKFALRDIAPGDPIRKYGEPIGAATAAIAAGAHVHVHNLTSLRARKTS
jgi:altronate dehydratase